MIGRRLDRLILFDTVVAYIVGLTGFVMFFMIFDIFERVDVFVDNKTGLPLILRYYASSIPYSAVLMSPIAMLLAVFMVLGQMAKNNEVTAMKNAGLSLYRVFLPLFLLGILASVMVFYLGDRVMPQTSADRKQIYDEKIRKRPPRQGGVRMNLNVLGNDGRIFAVRRFDLRRSIMEDLVIQQFRDGRMTYRVDARSAEYLDGRWLFREGVVRNFDGDRELVAPFDTLTIAGVRETPTDLTREDADANQMSLESLSDYARRLRQAGRPSQKYDTEAHLKLAFPFVNLMAVLLAAPLATRLRRGGIAIGFGLSFLLFLLYIGLVRTGQVLGHAGTLPPWVAAWLGNGVFGAAGCVLLYKAPK